MQKIQLKNSKKYRAHFPLIFEKDIVGEWTEAWCEFLDEDKKFLGSGYLSKQNKGVGWILSSNPQDCFDRSFFTLKFQKAKSKRFDYFFNKLTNAFRIFNGEGDGLAGLSIDWYAGHALFSWYNSFLYRHKQWLIEAFLEIFPEVISIYEKIRFYSPHLTESSHVWGDKAPQPLLIKENGVVFAVYLNEGLMTGIFLDQINVRRMLVNGDTMGKNVLNLFSYTGAFSVASAFGGATLTTSVDLAKRSLSKTKEQFQVNGFCENSQKIIVMDVFEYFKYAKRKKLKFDYIILDPPSFARNNKKKTFKVTKDYGELVAGSLAILSQKGTILASTNAESLSLEKYQTMIEDKLREHHASYKIVEIYRLPSDFKISKNYPEGNYLKVLKIEVKNHD